MTSRLAATVPGGEDTIVARATAPGRAALALVRLSGDRALAIARALGAPALAPRRATLATVRHPVTGERLDQTVVTAYTAPHSYTGEDVVEFSTHGGDQVPRGVLLACIAAGARAATPGEFTRRAVLNGRLDLVQAEAIAELIDAPTGALRRQALAQLDGGLSRRFAALREQVVRLEALLAYDIDFPEEDDGPVPAARITTAARTLLHGLDALVATAPSATQLRHGALVVIAGPPNVGKSSLFNALLGEARALVTPVAGTTRDAIEAVLDTPRMPLRLADTAGLRATDDLVERLGIEVSERYLRAARVVLACGEDAGGVRQAVAVAQAHGEASVVPVLTKCDVAGAGASEAMPDGWCAVSAETGSGLSALLARIDALVGGDASTGDPHPADDEPVVLRERQRVGLDAAREEVAAFVEGWTSGAMPAPVAAVHLHAAADALDAVIGRVSLEDVLDRVFRDFCIGK
jgi:tRNA modification GTPase